MIIRVGRSDSVLFDERPAVRTEASRVEPAGSSAAPLAGPLDADQLTAMDPPSRASALAGVQSSAGNFAVARLRGSQTQRRVVARDFGVTAAAAGLVLGGVSIVQSQVNASNGGLTYSSDQITYPKDLARVEGLAHKELEIAHFFSPGDFVDNDTTLKLHGDFTPNPEATPAMANVYIDLANTTTYYTSLLTFRAAALQTVYGSQQKPCIRFVCTGRFDPAGGGDTTYRVVVEVDQWGHVGIITREILNGDGTIHDKGAGFEVRVEPDPRELPEIHGP